MIGFRRFPSVLPTSIANLVGWWKADAGITLNVTKVSAWADQSGNGNDLTQGTAAKQPLYNTIGLNGLPTLTFTRASVQEMTRTLSTVTPAGVFTGNPDLTILIVFSPLDTSISGLVGFGTNTGLINMEINNNTANRGSVVMNGASPTAIYGPQTNTVNVAQQNTLIRSAGSTIGTNSWWQNGVSMPLSSSNNGTLTPAVIGTGVITIGGAVETTVRDMNGSISEVMVFNRPLNTTERSSMEKYLKIRWGL